MSDFPLQPSARFACEGCEKQYRWKPELAGRRVRCANCGTIMIAPQNPPDDDSELYDLVPESRPARKHDRTEFGMDLSFGACGMAITAPMNKSMPQTERARSTTLMLATAAAIASLTLIGLVFRLM